VIYGRQSRTKEGSESLNTQVAACRETAEHHRIEVVDVILEPPSTSAFADRGRTRPRFPEVLDLIRSGAVDCVVAYKTDRLSRGGGIGWAPLVEAAEDAGLDVDRFVLIAGNGFMSEFELGIRATMDREESKKTSERLRDMKDRHAADGKPWGGGARPFGYRRQYEDPVVDGDGKQRYREVGGRIIPIVKSWGPLVVDEAEATMVREAANRLLAGDPQAIICRDWNQQGKLTAQGKLWRVGTLRNVLMRASLAGLRVHNGDIVGKAAWPPILDRRRWEKVVALLLDNAERRPPNYRTSLLTGLARCGRCGANLQVAPVQGRSSYRCQKSEGRPGCSGIGIVAEPLEKLITDAVLETLDTPELAQAEAEFTARGPVAVPPEVEEDEAMLADLAADWASKRISRAEYLTARNLIAARIDERLAQVRRTIRRPALDQLHGGTGTLAERWEDLDRPARRAILAEVIESITIAPARRGLNRFDPSRVTVTWRA
jgi:DNA invertase Pin-like site-specific DNA recombinase